MGTKSDQGNNTASAPIEFTVASYNVENFFDQQDEERNKGYSAFRIAPNEEGSSNWGATIEHKGASKSFSQIKADGIRDVLLAIGENGPDIIGLQEIESQGSVDLLYETIKDLGYVEAKFSGFVSPLPGQRLNGIGLAIFSKFPIVDYRLLDIADPTSPSTIRRPLSERLRGVMKATIRIGSSDLIVYNNHWKSKGGPESWRMACAAAIEQDIAAELIVNPGFDYIILGDLNSHYKENDLLVGNARHNDTDGKSGIENVLVAQEDESLLTQEITAKYNLHYELPAESRKTHFWAFGDEWSALDHMIVGGGLYDASGITYVDNSFKIATSDDPSFAFLFSEQNIKNPKTGQRTTKTVPNRWQYKRTKETVNGKTVTNYEHLGLGYSDHMPIFATFEAQN